MGGGRGRKGLTLITGPARSGKTALVVSRALAARRSGTGRFIIVLPSETACLAARRRLLQALPAVETDVTATFSSLARRITAGAVNEAAAWQRELTLRQVVRALDDAGDLVYFKPIADLAGFYGKLAELISGLEASLVEPSRLTRLGLDGGRRDEELAAIYKGYIAALAREGLADGEGLVAAATEAVAKAASARLSGAVFIDGFTAFSANELALVEALAGQAASVTVTLPYDEARPELFGETARTIERLTERFDVEHTRLGAASGGGASARIAEGFMRGTGGAVSSGGGLKVISTAGIRMELEEIAREAKRLVREGRKPGGIAVVVRDMAAYGDLAKDVFDRMGVPLAAGTRLSPERARVLGVLDMLVEVRESDFGRAEVTALFSSSYVDLPYLAGGQLSGTEVARMAREAGIVKGMGQWRARLRALALRIEADAGDAAQLDEEGDDVAPPPLDATRIEFLLAALDELEQMAFALAATVPPNVMAERLLKIVERLGVRRRILDASAPEEVLFRDLAAYKAMTDAFEALQSTGRAHAPVTVNEFLDIFKRVVRSGGASAGEPANSGVRLVDAGQTANLSFPVVFLAGVSSESYPARPPIGPLYSRAETDKLAKAGVLGEEEDVRLAAERLLFYTAATRADEALYVTYPATDDKGKPKLPSFYLDDVLGLFPAKDVERKDYGPSRIVKKMADAASPREAAIAAGAEIGKAKSAASAATWANLALRVDASFASALRGAAVEARRESFERYDEFDGALSEGAAALVCGWFGPGRPWSASKLSQYGTCPMRFYIEAVLRAERPEEPGPVPTPLIRGELAHEILARFFADARIAKLMTAAEESAPAREELLNRSVDEVCVVYERRGGLAGDPFWLTEKRRLAAMIRRFADAEMERLASAKTGVRAPAFFELGFGLRTSGGAEEMDKASTAKAVEVKIDGRTELLRGRIDRVDFVDGRQGGAAARCVAVVDYKLSHTPSRAYMADFIDMQIAAYLYAAQTVVPFEGDVLPVEGHYRPVKSARGSSPAFAFDNTETYAQFRAEFAKALFCRADAIRRGAFATAPALGSCPPGCPGLGVCRYSERRAESLEEGHE